MLGLLWTKQNRLLLGPFDLNAVRLDPGVVFQGVVNDTPLEGVERFHFDDVAPAANFLGGFLGFFDQSIALLRAVISHVEGDLGALWIFLKNQSVGDVLQLAEGLSLAANETAGITRLHVERHL